MKNTIKYILVAGFLAATPAAFAEDADCQKLYVTVTQEVSASSSSVLEIVEKYIAANEACACEVVKAAIVATEADKDLVAQIVTTATLAAPEKLRLVAQCAIAVAPDALENVQAVMAKYDRQGGEAVIEEVSSAKGGYSKGGYSKGGYGDEKGTPDIPVAQNDNPLDGPGVKGGMGSFPLIPVGETPIHPKFPDITPVSATSGF